MIPIIQEIDLVPEELLIKKEDKDYKDVSIYFIKRGKSKNLLFLYLCILIMNL
jgi:hypothetical protein